MKRILRSVVAIAMALLVTDATAWRSAAVAAPAAAAAAVAAAPAAVPARA
jgi:hypothetical protein